MATGDIRFRFLAYQAPLTGDYDPTAEFEPWEPPPPFDESRSELGFA